MGLSFGTKIDYLEWLSGRHYTLFHTNGSFWSQCQFHQIQWS